MYDPGVGRWLQEDPIGFTAGDADLYRYVGDSPTTATDPSGEILLPILVGSIWYYHGSPFSSEGWRAANQGASQSTNLAWDHITWGMVPAIHNDANRIRHDGGTAIEVSDWLAWGGVRTLQAVLLVRGGQAVAPVAAPVVQPWWERFTIWANSASTQAPTIAQNCNRLAQAGGQTTTVYTRLSGPILSTQALHVSTGSPALSQALILVRTNGSPRRFRPRSSGTCIPLVSARLRLQA